MNQELKNDLIASWNEVDESIASLNELTDEEIIEHKQDILNRLNFALHWLGKYVSDDDVIE